MDVNRDCKGILSLNNSKCIKGIAAVMIMLGHFTANFTNTSMQYFFAGNLWVGLFFFYSGYGLQYSIEEKHNYLDGFVLDKIKKVYFPFLLAETLYTISMAILGYHYSLMDFVLSCVGIKLSNAVLWYVIEIIVCYALFYIANKTILKQYQMITWSFGLVLFIGVSVILDIGTCWYISTSGFVLGIAFRDYKQKETSQRAKKCWDLFFFLSFLALFIALLFIEINATTIFAIFIIPPNFFIVGLDILLIPLFIMSLNGIFRNVEMKNRLLFLLADISYDIYLIHMLVFLWVKYYIYNKMLQVIVSTVFVIGISLIKHYICKNVRKK